MFLDWVGSRGKRPFFAWLHYWDVHRPYARDPEFEAMYSDGSRVERKVGRELWHYNLNSTRLESLGFGDPELSFISDRYDAGIYMFDMMFKELLDGLREKGMYDNTLLVLTSDHGESLLERKEMFFAHDPFLYNEVIKVPLMIAVPGRNTGRSVDENVMLVDIYPSILRFLGIEGKYPRQRDGEALELNGESPVGVEGREILSECFGWRFKRAILLDRMKYIYDFEKELCEAYDLARDGKEETSLDDDPGKAAIPGLMNRYRNDFIEDLNDRLIDRDQYERLKALGYVES
jgi:arylsulfatase A-like enzyme